ncbi:hypothetical protein AO265_31885, partial [Pseudomonas sp. ABAC61]
MNGLSDVRLSLHSQELVAEQEQATERVSSRSAPSGLGRWGLYWHRLCTRKALLELPPEQLRDIGLTPDEAR